MTRVLALVPPNAGHVVPARWVMRELAARGHEVVWAGFPRLAGRWLADGTGMLDLGDAEARPLRDAFLREARQADAWAVAGRVLRRYWEPLWRVAAPRIQAAVARVRPDVALVDHHLAPAAVPALEGVPWATSCAVPTLVPGLADMPVTHGELDWPFSPSLVLGYTTAEVLGAEPADRRVRLVGPCGPPPADAAPRSGPRARSRVYASLGTEHADRGAPFLAALCEAAAGMDADVLVAAPLESAPSLPPNVEWREHVDQWSAVQDADVVVTHGGANTLHEALLAGKPLLVAPMLYDQPFLASRVEALGVGVRVRVRHVSPAQVRAGLERVLRDGSLAERARAVGARLAAAGGAPAAADALEGLA